MGDVDMGAMPRGQVDLEDQHGPVLAIIHAGGRPILPIKDMLPREPRSQFVASPVGAVMRWQTAFIELYDTFSRAGGACRLHP